MPNTPLSQKALLDYQAESAPIPPEDLLAGWQNDSAPVPTSTPNMKPSPEEVFKYRWAAFKSAVLDTANKLQTTTEDAIKYVDPNDYLGEFADEKVLPLVLPLIPEEDQAILKGRIFGRRIARTGKRLIGDAQELMGGAKGAMEDLLLKAKKKASPLIKGSEGFLQGLREGKE